ncbi:MAG: hypothetical protein M3548_18765 [Actinomycetota bacterium]|nr:hypothetical protein [Actinomycetota bacterium]
MLNNGITVDTWVALDANCTAKWAVLGESAQLTFDVRTGTLTLVADDDTLRTLADMIVAARHGLARGQGPVP